MDQTRRTAVSVLIATTLLAAAAGVVSAETMFQATLDEAQNVPPTGSGATGTATLLLNDAQTEVDYVVTYTDLEGNEVGAHIHKAPPGQNGSPVHTLPPGTPKFGRWSVTVHDVGDLFAGLVYVNVHTDAYFNGEIRGNFSESATGLAAEPRQTSWGRIKQLFE